MSDPVTVYSTKEAFLVEDEGRHYEFDAKQTIEISVSGVWAKDSPEPNEINRSESREELDQKHTVAAESAKNIETHRYPLRTGRAYLTSDGHSKGVTKTFCFDFGETDGTTTSRSSEFTESDGKSKSQGRDFIETHRLTDGRSNVFFKYDHRMPSWTIADSFLLIQEKMLLNILEKVPQLWWVIRTNRHCSLHLLSKMFWGDLREFSITLAPLRLSCMTIKMLRIIWVT